MKPIRKLFGLKEAFYENSMDAIKQEAHSARLTCIIEELRLHEEDNRKGTRGGLMGLPQHPEHVDVWVDEVLVLQEIK